MTTINWQKYEHGIVLGFQSYNETIDLLVAGELYKDAARAVKDRANMYKNVSAKIDRFGAYQYVINDAYKILGYENPDTLYLE